MEQKNDLNYNNSTRKVYKDKEIWVGSLLGGTLAAGYMVAENFKALGEPKKVRKTWIMTIAATLFIFYLIFFAPYLDRIPNNIFTLVWTAIIVVTAQIFQGEKIREYIRLGGQVQSWWKTLAVAAVGIVVTLIPLIGLSFLLSSGTDITIKNYGVMKHEISFDKNNLPEAEADAIAQSLQKLYFFDDEKQKFIYVKKVGSSYEISISADKSIKSNSPAIEWFTNLRNDMQGIFPNNKIIINLVVDDLDNVIKRLE